MGARTHLKKATETEVLIASGRRCCLCFFLHGREDVRKGQIAHINRKPTDNRLENLVYLCLEHHDELDSRPSQSKGLSSQEVREYRDRLYRKRGEWPKSDATKDGRQEIELTPLPETSEYDLVRNRFPKELDFTNEKWRYPLWQVANKPDFFAYKAGNRADGVCLIERIDLPDQRIVVVCIEVAGNPGQSITNSVEEICFQVCERFEIPAERLIWLEHYDYFEPPEWHWVTFARTPPAYPFEEPKWTDMTDELWAQLGLRPRSKLIAKDGDFESKLIKLFPWPTEAIFSGD